MTTLHIAHPRSHGLAQGRFSKFVAQGADAFASWNNARKTRKVLSRLSDRELEDIGLTRGDIEMVALKSARH